jgi:hypothetical protein
VSDATCDICMRETDTGLACGECSEDAISTAVAAAHARVEALEAANARLFSIVEAFALAEADDHVGEPKVDMPDGTRQYAVVVARAALSTGGKEQP